MNQGSALDAILHAVSAPRDLLAKPYLLPKYDDPEFVVRGIWHLYAGWFDGNPAHLKPAPSAELAGEIAALAGGAATLADRARALAEAGRTRLAAHLIELASIACAGVGGDSGRAREGLRAMHGGGNILDRQGNLRGLSTGCGGSIIRIAPVIASSYWPSADPPWMEPALTVMAGLVPAICNGRVPRLMAGTGPAMTVKATNRVSCLATQRRGKSPPQCITGWRSLRCARNDRCGKSSHIPLRSPDHPLPHPQR